MVKGYEKALSRNKSHLCIFSQWSLLNNFSKVLKNPSLFNVLPYADIENIQLYQQTQFTAVEIANKERRNRL